MFLKKKKFKTFGVDPAKNIYKISSKKHKIYCSFFDKKIVNKIKQKFDLIIFQNSFAHNPNPLKLLVLIKKLMHKNSTLIIQTSQADMCKNIEFDTVYHEHINFFNIKSMHHLTNRAGLNLYDVKKKPIHGTSYLFVIKKKKNLLKINKLIKKENYLNYKFYKKWAKNCFKTVKSIKSKLEKISKSKIVIGYGAAAKANTFLNFSKIKLNYIIDDNKLKQNKYCPGNKIQIKSPDYLKIFNENIIIVPLAWNFAQEIIKKVKNLRKDKKDKFIIFFPKFKIQK